MQRPTILVSFVLASALLAGCTGRDNGGNNALSLDLTAGDTHNLTANADRRTGTVIAYYEIEGTGDAGAKVRILLIGPDGTTLAFRDHNVQVGEHERFEARRGFASGGPAGDYAARIEVKEGSVRIVGGGVEFR